jgi:hypothetical protein
MSDPHASPLMGGALAEPQDHWPALFAGSFWGRYPYFLPCAVAAGVLLLAFFMLFFLEEVGPNHFIACSLLMVSRHCQRNVDQGRLQMVSTLIKKHSRRYPWQICPCDFYSHLPLLFQLQTTACYPSWIFLSGLFYLFSFLRLPLSAVLV